METTNNEEFRLISEGKPIHLNEKLEKEKNKQPLDLISTHKNESYYKNTNLFKSTPIDLISTHKNKTINNNYYLTENEKKITQNYNHQSIQSIDPQLKHTPKNKQNDISRNKSINKSVNKTKLKERNRKKAKTIIKKTTLTIIILLILSYGIGKTYNRIQTYQQTEQIKIELVTDFQNELEQNEIYLKDINASKECAETIKQNIDKFNGNFIQNNLFKFYLITNNDAEIMNKLSQKAYGMSFSQYIKDLGYFEKLEDSQGKVITIAPSFTKWENAQEAKALNQKNTNQETTKGVKK